jgi:peptide/nickel transport system permease protein
VLATVGVAEAIIIGASLSFIGLGVNPDQPDWGYLLSEGRNYLTDAWWYATFPGLAITLLVVSVNLLGDALRSRTESRQGQK